MGQIRWLLLAAVCAVHFALIVGFLHAGRSGQSAENPTPKLSLQIVNTQPTDRNESASVPAPPSLPKPALPTEKATITTSAPANANKKSDVSPETSENSEKSNSEPFPFFNRNRFLDAGDLDQSAVASKAFESALDKALPDKFESVVLEFLIDEAGQTVQLTCIEGNCSAELSEKLQQLVAIPFTPATKNGQPVASRKVIEIFPTPTFGF